MSDTNHEMESESERMKEGLVKRYVVFFIGLMVLSMGIAAITKANLGTSPITSIPYSLSMIFPGLTLGNFTIMYSLLLVTLQVLMLGRKANRFNILMQVIVSFVFGYLVDFGMYVFSWLDPQVYVEELVCVILGCCMLAFGVYIQIIANLVIIPGDGFAYTLTMKLRRPYRLVRTASDMSMVVIAAIIGLIGLGTLGGVREGTIISALIVGNIASLYVRKLTRFTDMVIPGRSAELTGKAKKDDGTESESSDGGNRAAF